MKRLLYIIFVLIPCSLPAKSMLLAAIPVPPIEKSQRISIRETMEEQATKEQCEAVEQHRAFYDDLQDLAPRRLQPYFGQRKKTLQDTLEQCDFDGQEDIVDEG